MRSPIRYSMSCIVMLFGIVHGGKAQSASQVAGGSPPSGPFGLAMGMTRAEIQAFGKIEATENGPNIYTLANPPEPHRSFESYMLVFSSTQGLCKIVAIGKTISTSAYGTELREVFEGMEEALARKYGKHSTYDYLRSESIWNEPRDWMMSLVQKERNLTAYWTAGESVLTDDIQAIGLESKALRTTSGYIVLSYEFENFEECRAEIQAVSNDPL